MTTTSKRAPKTPAGEPAGDEQEVVTPLPEPEDESPAAGDDEGSDDEHDDDEPKSKAKKKADDKHAPKAPAGLLSSLKRFWWDEEIR